jgi:glutamate-1-semialdehyde 2,1-aminomutase
MGTVEQEQSATGDHHTMLKEALHKAHDRYIKDHPLSLASHEEACKYLPGGNTRTVLYTTPFPLTFASGHANKLRTVDGHEYIDFLGEYTAGIYGHNHPVIRKAVDDALDKGWNLGGHNEMERRLAQIICERFPPMQMVRFVNSGTEANMMAIATAIAFTGRSKILLFHKGYHGSTISGRLPEGKQPINLPHDFVVAPYNDIERTKKTIDDLPRDSLAAILVEPMLGSGGCFVGREDFLRYLRDISSTLGALLIFDEVMTSRLSYSNMGLTQSIIPDMMTLGKWVGGGMSFGAFGGRKDIMSLYDPRRGQLEHPGTFNNNVLSMSAGIAGCGLLTQELLGKLNHEGTLMILGIDKVLERHDVKGVKPATPIVDEDSLLPSAAPPKMFITGAGSLMNIHFSGPEKEVLQGLFWHHMLHHGIYLAQRGFIALSIEIRRADVETFVNAIETFCQTWHQYLANS